MRLRPSLLLAALTACARPAPPTTAPPAPLAPEIADLEVARDAAPIIKRARHGPDVDAAIQALGRVADPPAVRELLALLAAGDLRAARALGVAKLLGVDVDPAAEAAILAGWPTRAPTDRPVLAEALGRLGTAAAVPTLAAALREGPAAAREPAAIALGLLARRGVAFDATTRGALLQATHADDPRVAHAATYALAHEHAPVADEQTVFELAQLARAADPEVRALALVGLTRRGAYPERTRRRYTTRDPEPSTSPARLADRRPPTHASTLRRALRSAPDPATHLLAAPPPTTPAPTGSGPTREDDDPDARRPLFHTALDDPDYRVRVAAVRGLLARGADADALHLLTWSRDAFTHPEATHAVLEALAGVDHLLDRPGAPQLPAAWRALARTLVDDADRLAARAAPEVRPRLARVACQARVLLARDPAWRPPLTCAGDLPAHLPAVLTAERLARGLAPPAERLAHLDRLRRDPDPRVRAAAISAAVTLRRAPTPLAPATSAPPTTKPIDPAARTPTPATSAPTAKPIDPAARTPTPATSAPTAKPIDPATPAAPSLEIPDAWLLDALADPSPAVAGSLADALAAKDAPAPPLADAVRVALAARARAERTREVELYASLTAAIAATAGPVDACTAGLDHANPSVRAAARACVTALTSRDPGPQRPAAAPARPPHAPRPGPRIRWRLTTTRGVVDVDLDPAAAPWHVATIVALTRAGFYDGLTFHRVVPGFVVQGGDPEGTGWGGPGYTLPSEPTAARFTRGGVGVADAGKDTGGCQFFFMQARAPHLEGRFTHIGAVTSGLAVVDMLLVGDRILRADLPPS